MSEAQITNSPCPSQQTAALLFIHAQTALHPGSGTALGTVDLPIQRERHTQWPIIPGSTLKGILRDAIREKVMAGYEPEYEEKQENDQTRRILKRSRRQVANEEDPMLVAVFGPGKVEQDSSHAGALSLTDARILAFPVRSLKGVFAWVTCSAVLERLHRDLNLTGANGATLDLPASAGKDKALCQQASPLLVDGNNRGGRHNCRLDCRARGERRIHAKAAPEPPGLAPRRRLHPFRSSCDAGRRPRRPGLRTQDREEWSSVLRRVPARRDAVLLRGPCQP